MAQGQSRNPTRLRQSLQQAIDSSFLPVLQNEFSQGLERFDYLNENVVAPYPAAGSQAAQWDQQGFDNYYQADESDPRREQADQDNLMYPLLTDQGALGVPNLLLLASPQVDALLLLRVLADSFYDANASLEDNLTNLTGATSVIKDEYGRERPATASESDPSYNSGHTTYGFIVNTALAWIFPERGAELFSRGLNFGESRVVHGSHWPTDTIASRAISYYETARLLDDDNTRTFIVDSARDIRNLLNAVIPGGLRNELESEATPLADQYRADGDAIGYYGQAAPGATPGTDPDNIPELADNLLIERYPYLSDDDRRTILAGTSYPEESLAGFMIDAGDPDSYWALLDLPNAYRGPAEIDRDLYVDQVVTQDDLPGYGETDTWTNDITGSGHLIKSGSGNLTLSGDNDFGGIELDDGTLTLTGDNQFDDTLYVNGGNLVVNGSIDTPVVLQDGTLSGDGSLLNLTVNGGDNQFEGRIANGPSPSVAARLVADTAAAGADGSAFSQHSTLDASQALGWLSAGALA